MLILEARERGCNKYEIHSILKAKLRVDVPSFSGIYNVLRRAGKNKLHQKMKEEKRRIIKEKAGELGHIDCHYLSKDLIEGSKQRYYLVCVIDSCTRIAWAEVAACCACCDFNKLIIASFKASNSSRFRVVIKSKTLVKLVFLPVSTFDIFLFLIVLLFHQNKLYIEI